MLKIQGLATASSQNEKLRQKLAAIEGVDEYNVDDLGLDFTVPGYDIELKVRLMLFPGCPVAYVLRKPGGRDIAVTTDNVDEYIREVIDAIIGKGALAQAQAFREGFSKVFPISDLQAFTADELAMLFGNADEDWSVESTFTSIPGTDKELTTSTSFERSVEGRSRFHRGKPGDPRFH